MVFADVSLDDWPSLSSKIHLGTYRVRKPTDVRGPFVHSFFKLSKKKKKKKNHHSFIFLHSTPILSTLSNQSSLLSFSLSPSPSLPLSLFLSLLLDFFFFFFFFFFLIF